MKQEFNDNESQGRSEEHIKRTYDGMRLQSKFFIAILFGLLIYSLIKFITE